jgi:hypothetical protein
MWDHSASVMSVRYVLLMLGRIPSHCLRTPFRTVSQGGFGEHKTEAAVSVGDLGDLSLFER